MLMVGTTVECLICCWALVDALHWFKKVSFVFVKSLYYDGLQNFIESFPLLTEMQICFLKKVWCCLNTFFLVLNS